MRHLACAVIIALFPTLASGQDRTAPTPPNVKVEGMPPIPQEIVDGVARYGQFRQAQMQAWNPAKRQMLITTTLGNVPQLHYLDGPGRDRRQITWYERGVGGEVNPSFDPADASTVVFQYDPAGS